MMPFSYSLTVLGVGVRALHSRPSAAPSSTFCPFHGSPVPAPSPVHRVSRALGPASLVAFGRRSQVDARRQEELSAQPSRTLSPSVLVLCLAGRHPQLP